MNPHFGNVTESQECKAFAGVWVGLKMNYGCSQARGGGELQRFPSCLKWYSFANKSCSNLHPCTSKMSLCLLLDICVKLKKFKRPPGGDLRHHIYWNGPDGHQFTSKIV